MSALSTPILTPRQVEQKIVRMAHEIHERNYREKELFVIGITGGGNDLAQRLAIHLGAFGTIQIHLRELTLQKKNPADSPVAYSSDPIELKGQVVILVDDVLNSGRTLIYASRYILTAAPGALSVATLIDRFHRRFPVHADYVGLTLSTNLKEHVRVVLTQGKESAYLE